MTARATARWAGTLEFAAAGRSVLIRDQAVTVYHEPAIPPTPATVTDRVWDDNATRVWDDNATRTWDS